MKIFKGVHKSILYYLFYEEKNNPMTGQPGLMPKEFPLVDELIAAGNAKLKIAPKVENIDNGRVKITFEEGEVEFTPSEIVILKKLFDSKKKWSVDQFKEIEELNLLFYPEKIKKEDDSKKDKELSSREEK